MGRNYSNSPIFSPICAYFNGKHCLLSRHDNFDYNSTDFSQIIAKQTRVGWGERPSVCDHLDVKEMSVSNILGALTHKTVFKFNLP